MSRRLVVFSMIAALGICSSTSAGAAIYRLAVTYTSPELISGPISFGLDELPGSVTSHFLLDGSDFVHSDEGTEAFLPAVQKGSVRFGDGEWTTPTDFDLLFEKFDDGSIEYKDLSYSFAPISTLTAASGIINNSSFVLHVSGVDRATGDPFQYQYNDASPVLTAVPEPEGWAMMLFGFGLIGIALRGWRRPNYTL
jgi:hypothetical protein